MHIWKIVLLSLLSYLLSAHGHMSEPTGPMIDGFTVKNSTATLAELVTSQITEGILTNQTSFKTQKIIHIDKIQGKRLVFAFDPFHSNDKNMSLTIFRSNNTQSPLLDCPITKGDVCSIQAFNLTINQTLIVNLSCSNQCGYQFSTYWPNVTTIVPGQIYRFTFVENLEQIYNINIDQSIDFQEVRIIVHPQTRKNSENSIKMYGNIGEGYQETTLEKHQFASIGLLNGAQGIFLTKRQFEGHSRLTLMLVGLKKHVFELTYEIITSRFEELSENKKIYELIEGGNSKQLKVNFKDIKNVSLIDEYEIGFAKMFGDLQVSFFTDEALTKKKDIPFFQYMKDIKFIFLIQFIRENDISQIFIRVSARSQNSAFLTEFVTKQDSKAVKLTQSIYTFLPIQTVKIFLIYFQHFIDRQIPADDGSILLDVNIIKVDGDVTQEFRYCQKDIADCLSTQNYQMASSFLVPVSVGKLGVKNKFRLKIQEKKLHDVGDFQQAGAVIALISNVDKKDNSLIAVDFSYSNSIEYLRQDNPRQQIVDKKQLKYYQFSISDKSVSAVRINVFQITGKIKVEGMREDPRSVQKIEGISSVGNIVQFKDNLNSPMYVIVEGVQQSMFSISVQVARIQDENIESNQLSISEDISYTLRLKPNAVQILKTNLLFQGVFFDFRTASGNIGVCLLDGDSNNCKQNKPLIAQNGHLNMPKIKERNPLIMLKNPSLDKFVEVVVIYHSADYDNCEMSKIGQFYNVMSHHEDCFGFQLKEPFETILVQLERIQIGPLGVKIFVCQKLLQFQWKLPRFVIPVEHITNHCTGKSIPQKLLKIILLGDQKQEMKIQLTTQYVNSVINLLDGVAFRIDGQNIQGVIKQFYYKLVNLIDTRIVLRKYRGQLQFYVKIIQDDKRQSITVNYKDHQYSSNDTNIFQNPYLVLKTQQFVKSSCEICGVLIAVQSSSPIGYHVDFSLQVIQGISVLTDNKMVENHLMKGSVAYYDYESSKDTNCNMIIEVSDHNKDCSIIYLSDLEYPSELNNLVKEQGNKLTYPGCKKQHYYIGIEATEDCPYSITVSNAPYSIVNAERGRPINIKLEKGQLKYLIYRHITNTGFKIVTMQKFGKVKILADVLTDQHLKDLKENSLLSSTFKFKSDFSNTLSISSNQGCSLCYYIVAIQCQKQVEASVIFADQQTSIQLVSNKILTDQLMSKGQTSNFTFSGILAGSLPITIYSGKIKATLKYHDKVSQKQFENTLIVQIFEFKLVIDQKNSNYDWDPIKLTVQCLTSSCIYEIGLVDETSTLIKQRKPKIGRGKPTFIFFAEDTTKCFTGFLTDAHQKIVITVDKDQSDQLQKLGVKILLDGKQKTDFSRNIVLNVMIISLSRLQQKSQTAIPYQICLTSSKKPITSIMEQTQEVNLLPNDIERVITVSQTFIIYPDGQFIVDIFECNSPTTFIHSTSQDDLNKESDFKPLDDIGMPQQPHAIKINSYLPVFLRVKSPLSIIRWMLINQQKEKGMGYLKYGTGSLSYQTTPQNINFIWKAISKKGTTKTTLNFIRYRIYLSNSREQLKSATLCERFEKDNVMFLEIAIAKQKLQQSQLTLPLKKTEIQAKFGSTSNIYMNVVGDAEIISPSQKQKIQYYRFLYQAQQIPSDVFQTTKDQNKKLIFTIGLIIVLLVATLIIAYVFVKKVVPMIGRINNRVLVEEDPQGTKGTMKNVQQPLPSNQRINIQTH